MSGSDGQISRTFSADPDISPDSANQSSMGYYQTQVMAVDTTVSTLVMHLVIYYSCRIILLAQAEHLECQ